MKIDHLIDVPDTYYNVDTGQHEPVSDLTDAQRRVRGWPPRRSSND